LADKAKVYSQAKPQDFVPPPRPGHADARNRMAFRRVLTALKPPDVKGRALFRLSDRTKMLHVKLFGTIGQE
jgi:hypothetical protein